MAKTKKQTVGGPFVAAAFFCEKLLREEGGVCSFIRMVDVLTVPKPDPIPTGPDGNPTHLAATLITLVITLKSGDVVGERPVRVEIVFPSGKRLEGVAAPAAQFMGQEKGVNLYAQLPVPVGEEGVYWYDVLLEGTLLTKMPLRIVYGPPNPSPGEGPESSTPAATTPSPTEARSKRSARSGGGRKGS